MKHPSPAPPAPAVNSANSGATNREKLDVRTRELARIAGRLPPEVSQADYEQARREVTGETNLDRQEAILDALPETERWDPVRGSAGRQAPESPSEDEDDEGRSQTEQLVDDGVAAAGRDHVRQAEDSSRKPTAETL